MNVPAIRDDTMIVEQESKLLSAAGQFKPHSARSNPAYSSIITLIIGLVLGASISSLSISSNQAATVMTLQKVSSCTFQDDKTKTKPEDDISISVTNGNHNSNPETIHSALQISTFEAVTKPTKKTSSSTTIANIKTASTSPLNDVVAPGDMIAYGSQGPASSYLPLKERFETLFEEGTYEFFYHSFDEDCSIDGCIYQKGTTFAEGKNIIVKAIATSSNYERFKYINLFDDDAVLWNTHLHPAPPQPTQVQEVSQGWTTFHQLLLKDTMVHPLVKPQFWHADRANKTDTYQSCTDEQMWVFRRDHLHMFYPFITIHKDVYWLSAMHVYRIMECCYPAGILVLYKWATHNPSHHYSGSKKVKNLNWVRQAQRDYLNMKLPELKPWIIPPDEPIGYLPPRCTIKQLPSQSLNQECRAVTESLFQRWVNGEIDPDDLITG